MNAHRIFRYVAPVTLTPYGDEPAKMWIIHAITLRGYTHYDNDTVLESDERVFSEHE